MKELFVSLLIIFPVMLYSQSDVKIDNFTINKFMNQNVLSYCKDDGTYYGAGNSLGGLFIRIRFREIIYNQIEDQITFKGVTYHVLIDDIARLSEVRIFSAKPNQKKLTNIVELGFSKSSQLKDTTDGDFEICFKINKQSRLYFEGSAIHFLLEFNIPALVKEIRNSNYTKK